MTDTIGHSHHGETESDGDAKETDVAKQSGTATAENQNERAEQFGEEFVTHFHNSLNFRSL